MGVGCSSNHRTYHLYPMNSSSSDADVIVLSDADVIVLSDAEKKAQETKKIASLIKGLTRSGILQPELSPRELYEWYSQNISGNVNRFEVVAAEDEAAEDEAAEDAVYVTSQGILTQQGKEAVQMLNLYLWAISEGDEDLPALQSRYQHTSTQGVRFLKIVAWCKEAYCQQSVSDLCDTDEKGSALFLRFSLWFASSWMMKPEVQAAQVSASRAWLTGKVASGDTPGDMCYDWLRTESNALCLPVARALTNLYYTITPRHCIPNLAESYELKLLVVSAYLEGLGMPKTNHGALQAMARQVCKNWG